MKVDELIAKITNELPLDLRDQVHFEEIDEYLTIKPDGFLGADKFAALRTVVEGNKGEYVSAGKWSHFRIQIHPKKDTDTLRQWYEEQKLREIPLTTYITLQLSFNITKPEDIGRYINEAKKHVRQS